MFHLELIGLENTYTHIIRLNESLGADSILDTFLVIDFYFTHIYGYN